MFAFAAAEPAVRRRPAAEARRPLRGARAECRLTPMGVRVNFLLIGPGKSGTTAFHALLRRHPQVTMAQVKETCYFNDHHWRGVGWYHSLFEDRGLPAVGEVSNTYIFSPEAAVRAAEYNAGMRAVACLRNPIERTCSHWLHSRRNGQVRGTFEDFLRARPYLVEHGMYARHLDPWIAALGRQNVKVMLFDHFAADPLSAYNDLLRFLGLQEVTSIELSDRDRLSAGAPRSVIAARAVKAVARVLRNAGHPALIQRVKDSALPRLLYRRLRPEDRPEVQPQTRDRLKAAFREDAERISDLVGVDVCSLWGLR